MIAYWLFIILTIACLVLIGLNQLDVLSDIETGWLVLILASALFLFVVPAMLSAFFQALE